MYLFRIVFLQCLYCFILCISKSLFKNFFLKKYSLSTLSKTVFQKQTSKSKYLISLSILRLLHFFGKIYYFQKLHTQRECPKSLIQKFFSTELSWWPSINMKTIKSKVCAKRWKNYVPHQLQSIMARVQRRQRK